MRIFLICALFALMSLPGPAQHHGNPYPGDGCHADFSSMPDAFNPLVIHFSDHSFGPRTSWTWSFGDGATSTLQNPVHTYSAGEHYWVCLTVDDSVSFCSDRLCIQLTVHEPGVCLADFEYFINPGNPLEVRFEDRSSVNVNAWHWFFGDGTSSDERNPVHTYATQGKYNVCLTAYKPGTPCNDIWCDTIEVSADPACQAMFTVRLDSLNPVPDTYIFHDISPGNPNDIFWRFDDGATYTTHDVIHHFLTPGPHEVCLNIRKLKHGAVICSDSVCQDTPQGKYYDLGGHIFTGAYPINNPLPTGDTGIAVLYRKDGTRFLPFDSTQVTTLGYYAFPKVLGGQYTLAVRLTPGSANFLRVAPGYYPSALHWQDAGFVDLTNGSSYQQDVHMVAASDYQAGSGSVQGQVTFVDSKDNARPAQGACVLLFNGQMEPARYAYTGFDGRFIMTDLPFGAYQAYAEYPGSYSRMTAVWLDSTTTQINDLDLGLFDHDVTSVAGQPVTGVMVGSPFPNPSHGLFTFVVRLPVAERLSLTVTTLSGVTVWSGSPTLPAGETLVRLPKEIPAPGIYLLSVTAHDGALISVKKLLTF